MSQYVECKPGYSDIPSLVDALVALGYAADQIEVHQQPQTLFDYHGEPRPQMASVVIRRRHVDPYANDVGWLHNQDGTLTEIISEYDLRHKFNEATRQRLKQEYAAAVVTRQQVRLGRDVTRTRLPTGEIQLTVRGLR